MANHVSDDVMAASRMLAAGKLVAFPTETVYGLGADAENPAAIAAIFALKNRPSNHPLIVHVAPQADIGYWSSSIPDEARKLIDAFWPGPLTLILKKAAHVPDVVSGGQDSVGLRCPSHPVAQALLRTFKKGKGGLAAPSANRFGHVSPTRAEHVSDEFGDDPRLALILEGGQSEVGIESTILDLSRIETAGAVLLRPGKIQSHQIADIIGRMPALPDATAPRASGTLASHYAPSTPVVIVSEKDLIPVLTQLEKKNVRVALLHYSSLPSDRIHALVKQTGLFCSPEIYSRYLYASLRELDRHHADLILVEATPETEAWSGINDRLRRAAYNGQGVIDKWLEK